MKSIFRFSFFALLLTSSNSLFAQVDSLEWLYYTYMPNGSKVQGLNAAGITIDLRLANPVGNESYYLEENKTFSFRKANGLPTDTYYSMAGFTSTQYKEGNLRRIRYGANTSEMNYRLMFPKNYAANPSYPNGYPMIIMIHGFGERGNCWGTNCYWPNTSWQPGNNGLNSKTILSVARESTSSAAAVITTSGSHGFTNNNLVFISSTSSAYNGIRRLISINGQADKFKISSNLNAIDNSNIINFGVTATGTVERNVAETYRITSVANSGGAVFTTSAPHQFVNGQTVIITNSTVAAYNGSKTVSSVTSLTPTTFKLNSTSFAGYAQADIARTTVYNLLNNDHSMTHGGLVHQNAVNLVPNGMTPDDPAMPDRAFPGFMFYAQNLNGWATTGDFSNAIRIIRLLVKKYNIDPNRIYIHGLSDGGAGTYKLARSAPWMFAAALPMSAVDNAQITGSFLYPYVSNIPFWLFQGGQDGNPKPSLTEGYLQNYRANGMNVKYTLYPTLGHGTWNAAYAEPDFFTWIRSQNKANIQVLFGKAQVCGTSGAGVQMVLAQGFFAYEWEKDGVAIPGATDYEYTAFLPGTYRARFSRKPNPTATDWNRWSDPVLITESAPAKPAIIPQGSTVFNTINGNGVNPGVAFKASVKADRYTWYKNDVQIQNLKAYNIATGKFDLSVSINFQDTISMIYQSFAGAAGAYTLKTADFGYCQSVASDPIYYVWDTGAPSLLNITAPTNFAGSATSSSSIFLSWTDMSANEKGFEIWRRASGATVYDFVTRTAEDEVSFLDTKLIPGTTYEYKIRAVSNGGRSNHVPSNNVAAGPLYNLVVTTLPDTMAPTPPQNLLVTFNTINSISLSWQAGTDESGVKRYVVYYGNNSVATTNKTTIYVLTGLTINTAYPITVRTEDNSSNLSPPSNQVTGTTFIDGLYYDHSTGAWNSLDPTISANAGDTPPINWTTAEFTGKIANFNVDPISLNTGGVATQNDFYKFKFDGYLNIPTATGNQTQVYQFRTTSDDGSMLFLENFNPIDLSLYRYANNDGLHGNVTVPSGNPNSTWDVTLSPGPHRIVVLFNEYTGGQSLLVEYRIKNINNSYGAWITIPNSMLKSGTYTPPPAPAAPTTLAATATGMTNINLTWAYGGAPADEFEIYRSLTLAGTYALVGRGTGLAYTDATVVPNTTYYYKLKTVNANGTSAFSNSANATTLSDTDVPTVPAFVTLVSKTFTNVAFNWTASTDNVGVTGYEILADGNVIGTSQVTSYMATNLAPGTLYNFTVKAFDASGNKSAASSPLAVTTNAGIMYYSKASGALNVNTNWGQNGDGSGTAPTFANNGQIYIVANRASTGLGGALTIGGSTSKIIVPSGTTLDVDNILSAKIELQGDGVVNLNNSVAPEFVSISPTSTINFNTYTTVPAGTYGNVILSGVAGNKNFAAGQATIMGSLTVADGIALKGAPTNGSHVTIGGDITLNGTPGTVAADNALDVTLVKSGTQTITLGGSLDLFKITTSAATNVNFVNGGSAVTINVGSPNGGGLSIATGSSLNLGTNHFVMKNAGTINAGSETGKLGINGGNVNLTSSSTQSSNLYFDTTLKTAGLFTSNFSSTGKLLIKSALVINDGLKIKAGEFNTAGFVTLISNSTNTAYLQEIEGNGSVTGNVNVQRWLSAVRKYRYMSSVVANMKVADWQTYMPITGPFTGANTNATSSSMFYYIENGGGYKAYPASGSNNQVEFGKGVGYSIFNFNGASPLTLQMTGVPYQGNVVYTLTPGTGGNDGWNLIGNPYASSIQWNNNAAEWTKTNVGPVVSVPDNSTGSIVFKTYDAGTGAGTLTGGIIAPGQAFWVQTSAAATLTVKEKAKRTDASWLYREGSSPEVISMVLSNGTAEDHAYVILGSDYSDTYQPETDGMKRKNDKLNLSTRSADQVNLVFNKLEDSFCEKVVPVTIEDAAPGNYSLTFSNVSTLVGVGEVTLTDNFTSTTIAVNDSQAYNFAITTDAASTGTGRFKLTLNRPALEKNAITSIDNLCGGTGATVQLTNTQAGVFYYATKADGTSAITEEAIGTGGALSLQIPVSSLTAGSNSLFIRTGFKGCSNELLMANPLSFTYTPAPSIKVDDSYFSICEGSAITLRAEAGENNTFNWYKGGVLIEGQHQASLATDFIKSSSSFEVAAVTANGCEGAKAIISVEAENVPFPFVDFNGEKLVLATNISENIFVQWYKDQEPLEQYTPMLQPAEEGNYSVLVSHNGCSKISDPFQYVVTAIEPEPESNTKFAAYLYPNPATSENLYVKLETPSTQDALIEMFDLAGRKAYATLVNGAKANGVHKINFSQDTAPGLYILTIKQGNLVMQRKVMVTFR